MLPGYLSEMEVQTLLAECLREGKEFTYQEPVYDGVSPLPSVGKYLKKCKKAQLLASVPITPKKYVIDEKYKAAGLNLIRLPPYHCEFNPIELVWAQCKGEVAKKNVTYELQKAMDLMREAAVNMGPEEWAKLVEHAIKEEKKAMSGDVVLETLVERAIEAAQARADVGDSEASSESDTPTTC